MCSVSLHSFRVLFYSVSSATAMQRGARSRIGFIAEQSRYSIVVTVVTGSVKDTEVRVRGFSLVVSLA